MKLPNRKQKSDWWTWGIISLLYKLNCSREISTIEKMYLHTRNITLIFHAFEIANQLLICLISTMNEWQCVLFWKMNYFNFFLLVGWLCNLLNPGQNYGMLIGSDRGHFFLIMRPLLVIKRGHDYLMLIGYKSLGHEVSLPMKLKLKLYFWKKTDETVFWE